MLQYERQQEILAYLELHQSARMRDLAAAVYASEASVRRDIAALEAQGIVERVYGGVLLAKYKNEVVPVELRDGAHSAAKDRLAAEAAKRIRHGDTVMMDASTTVLRICRHMHGLRNVKIITNNLRVCTELAGTDIQIYCTGGAYYGQRQCFLGPGAEQFLRGVTADILFFSSQGITETGEITDVDETEISLRRVMMRQSKKRIFLCDCSKIGIQRPFRLCGREDVDEIISDAAHLFKEAADAE